MKMYYKFYINEDESGHIVMTDFSGVALGNVGRFRSKDEMFEFAAELIALRNHVVVIEFIPQ